MLRRRYTYGEDGTPLDGNKYYWALAEFIAAAGLLAHRTKKKAYASHPTTQLPNYRHQPRLSVCV